MTIDREQKAKELLALLKTTPAFVFCGLMFGLSGDYYVDPTKLEALLVRRGQMREDESLKDALMRNYGERAAKLAEELI